MSYLEPRAPGPVFATFAVGVPILAIVLELATGLCAGLFFDPMPSWGHLLLVLSVPAANFLLIRQTRRDERPSPRLVVLAGAAIAVGAVYAIAFLPVTPFALVALIALGIGLLPLSPAFGLFATVKLLIVTEAERPGRRILLGLALGLLAFVAVDLPATATQLALRWQSEAQGPRAAALMRSLGDEELLLRLCYGGNGHTAGPASFLLASLNESLFARGRAGGNAAARELYFRTTGRAFNAEALKPRRGFANWRTDLDEDVGGEQVGGKAKDVTLAESRIDGSVAAADNVAYLEWTALFANASELQREARLTLVLPEGAVASRATLWVNGKPREASIAGRAAARAAYLSIVRTSRDPLLVTTDGAGRLLVQAFPIQPGATLKLRIGITAPLAVAADGRRSLALPAIADRNIELAPGLAHRLWIEADAAAGASGAPLDAKPIAGGAVQLRGRIDDAALSAQRVRIRIAPLAEPSMRTANVPAADKQPSFAVVQRIDRAPVAPAAALHILLDGSANNRAAAVGLQQALGSIPAGLPVALQVAAETPRSVPAAPWSPAQRALFEAAIDGSVFEGGQDAVGALAEALESAGGGGRLLWIHGPQPVVFAGARARLDQMLERRPDLPALIRYQAEPGPAFTVSGHRWFETARAVTPGGGPAADLAALLADQGGGVRWQIGRVRGPGAGGGAQSLHIARLWAADALAGAAAAPAEERKQAIDLAHRLNIVTPVSGAVVLETDREYGDNGLPVPDSSDVPTVPEPGTWALMAIAAALLGWFAHRRRQWFAVPRPTAATA